MESLPGNLTTCFQVATALMILLTLLTTSSFDKYLPKFALSTIRFGRSGLANTPNLLDVPKSWFTHFYVFAFSLNVVLVVWVWDYYRKGAEYTSRNLLKSSVYSLRKSYMPAPTVDATTTFIALFLFLLQTGRRLYECVCVSVFSNTRMNVLIYLAGFFHYFGASWSILMQSPGLCCASGSPNDVIQFPPPSLTSIQWFGICVFTYAFLEQFRSHSILAGLRKQDNKVTTLKHKIPHGGLFSLISCPNYFAEILVYFGLALTLGGGANSAFNWVLIWVTFNQVYSASIGHQWYVGHFPDYPPQRKALIPYIF